MVGPPMFVRSAFRGS